MLIASVMEFSGAVLVGSRVADTIRNKIISVKAFKKEIDVCTCRLVALAYCCYQDGSSRLNYLS